ncbi:MAG: GHKL domain-containing protein [Defluviitaleaceae bacterium]|nr:GHKL domain-containing protein [Defluviitaleaceae bacterium]
MEVTYVVAYLLSSVLVVLAVERFMKVFFENRKTGLLLAVSSYLLYLFFSSFMFLMFDIPLVNGTISIVAFLIISTNYEASLIKKIFATVCCFVFFATIETLVIVLFNLINVTITGESMSDKTLVFIIRGFFSYILSYLLQSFKAIRKNHNISSTYWLASIFIPILLLYTVVVLIFFTNSPPIITISIIVAVLGVNVLALYLQNSLSAAYEDELNLKLYAQEKEYYLTQYQTMQESIDKVKSLRHDMKLHLATIETLLSEKNLSEISDYVDTLLGEIRGSEVYSDTGNLAFDSIINHKLRDAGERKIKLSMEVDIPQKINVEIVDVATILGNLLDNALDAIETVNEKWLKLRIRHKKEVLYIKVENPFDGRIIHNDENNKNINNIVSRKTGADHGYGLKNIRKSVDKYNGEMDITHDKNTFSVSLLLLVNSHEYDVPVASNY